MTQHNLGYFFATYGDAVKFDQKPNEDFYFVSKKYPIFSVADGVTQSHFENGNYAFPNGAKKAAEIFCKATVGYLEKNFENKNLKDILEKAFDFTNEKIKNLNIRTGMAEKLDYVIFDYFDAVGIAGFLKGNTLHYGYVGDCGLIIFDKNNRKKFQTKDMVKPAVARYKKLYEKNGLLPLDERTKIIHKIFRNNPDKKGYGSFTGEESVKNYYKFGSIALQAGDLSIFYTDGAINYLKIDEFVKILREEDRRKFSKFMAIKLRENIKKYGSDRTFISFIFIENSTIA